MAGVIVPRRRASDSHKAMVPYRGEPGTWSVRLWQIALSCLRIEPPAASRPLRASSALPCTPQSQQHRYITHRHRFDKCPPKGGERRYRADGPRKGTKKCARESGREQSAGELRSPLSRYGFAFAPDSTPLVGLRPPDPP